MTGSSFPSRAAGMRGEEVSGGALRTTPAGDPITYALAGVTPHNWSSLEVVDLSTDALVNLVVEVDTVGGWLKRRYRDSGGKIARNGRGKAVLITMYGHFALRVRPS